MKELAFLEKREIVKAYCEQKSFLKMLNQEWSKWTSGCSTLLHI